MKMRLIDADKLEKKAKFNLQTGSFIELSDLQKAPPIDAEPVVHCKDCRFGTQSKQEPKDYFVRCIHNPFHPEHFHKNHYCGFGAKMDEEATK